MNHPKVLFLTPCSFNRISGGGVTFSNLFSGWGKNNIATVHADDIEPSNDICDRYYKLQSEIKSPSILQYFKNLNKINHRSNNINNSSPSINKSLFLFFLLKIKFLIFGDGLPQKIFLSHQLIDWIDNFKPDLLYTPLGSNSMMELSKLIIEKYKIPIVIHIMDDWPSIIYRGGILSFIQRSKMHKLLHGLINIASARIAISEEMAKEYEIRFMHPFHYIHNGVEININYIKKSYDISSPARISYIGSIFPMAQLQSLLECCDVVANLASQGQTIQLSIYCPKEAVENYFFKFIKSNFIKFYAPISDDDEYFRILRDSDLLLLPVNFDSKSVSFIRYSMPTKLPSYLSVAVPILVYGPDSVLQVSYAKNIGWGLVVDQRDKLKLESAFIRLLENQSLRKHYGLMARKTAQSNHNLTNVRNNFQHLLKSCVPVNFS